MSATPTNHPRAHHPHRIDLRLREVNQLINSLDPSPFPEKDLDHDAEEFIVSWAQEYPHGDPVMLRIQLEEWPAEEPGPLIREAVHHYFAYRAKISLMEFRHLMREGRICLLIGLVFMGLCFGLERLIPAGASWGGFLREGLTIAGWVAMWRPMQIYLYDWWPVRRRGSIYAKLARMPIEVVHGNSEHNPN